MTIYNFDGIVDRANTNSVKYDLRKEYFNNQDVLPMWVADMDFETPSFVLDALRKRLDHPVLGYTIRSERFNQSIVEWVKRKHGWEIDPEWICFSPGIVPALNMLVMSLSEPGDNIILQPPVYFPFFSAIQQSGRKVVENPLKLNKGRLNIDFDDLEEKISSAKMLMFCSPHNPGGSVWSREDLKKIADLCVRYKVLLISDEIHSDLVFKPNKHIPVAGLNDEVAELSVTCMAPSKTFNLAGLSTSFLIISNPELRKRYDEFLNDKLHLGMGNIFGAEALKAAYTYGDEWLEQLLAYLEDNISFAVDYFEKYIPRIKVIRPEATYMLWLDCRELNMTEDELNHFFIHKASVGLNSGAMFDTGGTGFQRLNLACPRSVLKKGLSQIEEAVNAHTSI